MKMRSGIFICAESVMHVRRTHAHLGQLGLDAIADFGLSELGALLEHDAGPDLTRVSTAIE